MVCYSGQSVQSLNIIIHNIWNVYCSFAGLFLYMNTVTQTCKYMQVCFAILLFLYSSCLELIQKLSLTSTFSEYIESMNKLDKQ